jgi:type IV pilus assembly protein PilC
MRFSYKAVNHENKTISGVYDAPDRDSLIATLNKQNLRPILIKLDTATAERKSGLFDFFRPKVKLKDMVMFNRQLSTMISAGVPLPRALVTLQAQTESDYFKKVIGDLSKDIEAGLPLGDAFAKYPNVFSEVYVNMVRAGEAGGILDEIFKRLAYQAEKDATIRKKIKGAMAYPTVILSITVVAFFFIMIFIIPKLGNIFTQLGGPHAKLPIYTRALLSISNFCIGSNVMRSIPGISMLPIINRLPNMLFIIILVILIVFYLLRYIKTPKGKYHYHALLLKIPILNTIVIKISIARFARIFSSLTSSGVTVLDALEVTGGSLGNKVIEAELTAAAKEVRNGRPLSEPLSKSKLFPPIVAQMLAVGEETGQIDTILVKIADFYEEDVDTVIDSLSAIIEPIMIIILGAIVGVIAASVMGPIASLSQQISPTS